MSNTAFIRDISSLKQLRISIGRFCDNSLGELNAINSRLQSRLGFLLGLRTHFETKVEQAEHELQTAKSALQQCESQTTKDEKGNTIRPNCSGHHTKVQDCQKKLEEANRRFQVYRSEVFKAQLAINNFHSTRLRYSNILQFEKEHGTSSLQQIINGAEDYLAVTNPVFHVNNYSENVQPASGNNDSSAIVNGFSKTVFSIAGAGGALFEVINTIGNNDITSSINYNNAEHICSRIKIEKNDNGTCGKIIHIEIPSFLQNERIGSQLLQNMEVLCRNKNCTEIGGWSGDSNLSFYRNCGYRLRNETPGVGAEIFKPLN